MKGNYVPRPGDVIWLSFDPQAGNEQAGTRPAVVLSPATYNAKTSMAVCCPITSHVKNYPFEVMIRDHPTLRGAILADQSKNLDWRARKARHKGKVSDDELAETLGKIRALLGIR